MRNLIGKDLNGNRINIGDSVLVPRPTDVDVHENEFVGFVSSFRENAAMVNDDEGITHYIETARLEVLPKFLISD